MQSELDSTYPMLDIQILGINLPGLESGNPLAIANVDIPWLQDDVVSDVWNQWEVTWRDVIILDKQNRPSAVYNLTINDLGIPENYNTLLDLFVDAATFTGTFPGNFDFDDNVDGLDFLSWQGGFGSTYDANHLAKWEGNFGFAMATAPGNFDSDDNVDGFDFLSWQGGFGSIYDANDLADWEDNFGLFAPSISASTAALPQPATAAIPEPTTCGLALVALSMAMCRRRFSTVSGR